MRKSSKAARLNTSLSLVKLTDMEGDRGVVAVSTNSGHAGFADPGSPVNLCATIRVSRFANAILRDQIISAARAGREAMGSEGGISAGGNVTAGRDLAGRDINTTTSTNDAELVAVFDRLRSELQQAPDAVAEKVDALEAEVTKGDQADDETIAGLLEEIAKATPDAVSALIGIFAPASVAKAAGSATRYVLGKLKR